MNRLFGTDGIRGRAGEFPLDIPTIKNIGSSLVRHLTETLGRPPVIVTGRDTRESGIWIESAFHNGALATGAQCLTAGVLSTPGVAFLTKEFGCDAGVVISASHNPYHDNGIKVFAPSGRKIDEDTEQWIERDIHEPHSDSATHNSQIDDSRATAFQSAYCDHLTLFTNPFKRKVKIVVDCANGAQSSMAKRVLESTNAHVIAIHCQPDGRNINEGCGSLHLENLRSLVIDHEADIGIAFDGDADRSLYVDEYGQIVDGDAVLWVMAKHLLRHGKLKNLTVVATVMSNIGLERAFGTIGVSLNRTSVGDKYVLDELLKTGSELGGEQSGHIIFPETSLVGDGMVTALGVLSAMNENDSCLSELVSGFVKFPQVLINTAVSEKRPFYEVPEIEAAAKEIENELGDEGRLLLRYSGTENLARVMIEGKDQTEIETQANRLSAVIERTLG
jgi:phosphoglucosamine mutase